MAYRDTEFLVLSTLCSMLVDITGIASGSVFAKMPDYEFVNKINTTQPASTNRNTFPAIGMRYWDKTRVSSNRYGESYLIDNGDGTAISYEPMAEISMPLSIYLFTDSRYDQMSIGNKIIYELSQSKFYPLTGDINTFDEYAQVEFIGYTDVQENKPYVKCFDIKVSARTLLEVSGYVTDSFYVGLQSSANSIDVNVNQIDDFSYFLPEPPATIDPDVIYFQDWNIINIDMTTSDGGDMERTLDTEAT